VLVNLSAGALLLAAVGCQGEAQQLPRLGEVVLSVDTDAPVPDFVGRLRIDAFDEEGRWLESSDFARSEQSDWPASFSLYTNDEQHEKRVLIRARAYLEGRQRDYRGERFQERRPYVEPWSASNLSALCSNLPELELGQELTLRRGPHAFTGMMPVRIPESAGVDYTVECGYPLSGGVAAAALTIREAGDYRIETTAADPLHVDPTVFVRTRCEDATTQIGCNDDISGGMLFDPLSRLFIHLEPGHYTVLSGAYFASASDVTLRADLVEKWPESLTPQVEPEPASGPPRLVIDGQDRTPLQEPGPGVTIDRLALVTLKPGQKRQQSILLRLACGGQMAKLSHAGSYGDPVLSEAETCVDHEGERVPVAESEQVSRDARPAMSLYETFAAGQSCPKTDSESGVICIPGGGFVFGSQVFAPYPLSNSPERFALMRRYWLDETEVTVGRFRAALARGFQPIGDTPYVNEGPLLVDDGSNTFRAFLEQCTFSRGARTGAASREDFPLNCVDFASARAFCAFEGGDLPTEAQWQYAVTKAGRALELEDLCSLAGARADSCKIDSDNARSVNDEHLAADITPLGVRGLLGNVSEWTLDSFQPLDAACWNGATLVDPTCWEKDAPMRVVVGGDWSTTVPIWRRDVAPGGTRSVGQTPQNFGTPQLGFRCAYREEPQ
jgi:formylglycine-generating enzyme required for sulfatase activity